jgi:hypothetical protein
MGCDSSRESGHQVKFRYIDVAVNGRHHLRAVGAEEDMPVLGDLIEMVVLNKLQDDRCQVLE